MQNPMERVMEVFGSPTNVIPLYLLYKEANRYKGNLLGKKAPVARNKFQILVNLHVAGKAPDTLFLTPLKDVSLRLFSALGLCLPLMLQP